MICRKVQGFTLIEIALALGIISFVVTGIFGLMAVGINTLHSSINHSVEARIAQQVFEKAQLSDFGNLVAHERYFNARGHEVVSGSMERQFVASITFQRAAGSITHNFSQDLVKDLVVEIRNVTHSGEVRTYSAVMVKSD